MEICSASWVGIQLIVKSTLNLVMLLLVVPLPNFTIAEDSFLACCVSIWEGFVVSESNSTVQAEYLALTGDKQEMA